MFSSARAVAAAWNGLDWDRGRIDRNRDACLRSLIEHAYRNVPYYRRAFDRAGVSPVDIRGWSDLHRIPATTREDIQSKPDDFLAQNTRNKRLISHRSSGSQGAPVWTRRTHFEERLLAAIRLRVMMKYGLRLSDRRASVSMEESDVPGGDRPIAASFGIFRRTLIDAGLPPQEALARLCGAEADVITAYPAALARLTEFITSQQRRAIRLRFITLGGEMVLPSFRRQIASCFVCPIYETYGATEANLIAWECPATGNLHICEPSVIVEVCRDGRPVEVGEEGEAIVTVLHSRAMPFLRYRLNDLVTRGPTPCPCGNPTATLQAIRGRTNDWLSLPDGRRLHPFVVSEALMKCVPGIRRLQVVQSSERELTILIVPGEPLPAADLEEAQSKIAASIDHCLGITIRQVEHLEAAPNRKFNPFVPLSEKPGSQKPTRAAGV